MDWTDLSSVRQRVTHAQWKHTEVCLAQASWLPASERMRSSHTLPLNKCSSQDSAFQWGMSNSRMQWLHSSLLPSCSSCMPSEACMPSALAMLLSSQCNLILLIFLQSYQSLLHPLTQQLGASPPRVSQTQHCHAGQEQLHGQLK